MSTLDAALAYADEGIPVFPLSGKVPMIKKEAGGNGYKDATVDEPSIRQWWALFPDANIGTPTGVHLDAVTGRPNVLPFDVVDVDPRHDGPATLARLVADHGPLPATPTQTTGSNGRHFLFRATGTLKCSDSELGPGLDTKGQGGYIVLAPSIHPETKCAYQWRDGHCLKEIPLAVLPEWVLELVAVRPIRTTVEAGDPIPEGRRNDVLASRGGSMRRVGFHADSILAALQCENALHCQPPLPEWEVARIAASIARYEPESDANNYFHSRQPLGSDVNEMNYAAVVELPSGARFQGGARRVR